MKRAVLLLVVLTGWVWHADGAYPKVRNFPKSTYKAGAQSWDIAQTAGGCVYFANHTGLIEFDGNEWEHYYVFNGTAVRSLKYVAEENRLYAGAFDEFGYYEPEEDGRLRYVSLKHLFPDQDLMTEFWKIHKIDNSLFFCTDWDIFKYTDGVASVFNFAGNKIDCSATIYNSLFVSSHNDGPMILSGEIFIPLPGAAKLAGKKICAMIAMPAGEILLVTDTHGLYLYNGSDIVKQNTALDDELSENQVYCAAMNGRKLALGTIRNGLYIIDMIDGQTMHLNRSGGLQNNTVLSMFFDSDSNLWLGLDNGIDYVMLDLPDYPAFSRDVNIGAGYGSLIYHGDLYLGTNQGLFRARNHPGLSVSQKFTPVGNSVAQVWHLSEIDNTLFCGHDRGLLIVNDTSVRNIMDVMGVWKVMPLKRRKDIILGCSYQGLFVLKKTNGQWNLSHHIKGINESSGMFIEDADGSIWISHWMKGLFHLKLDEEMRNVVSMEYFGVNKGFPTERNNIPYEVGGHIVFSSEGGFYKYDPAADRMVYEDKLNHLFADHSPVSIRIHDLGQGDLMFISESFCGVALNDGEGGYRLDSLSLRHIAGELIIGFENINTLNDTTLLISNQNGFSLVDLSRIRQEEGNRPNNAVFIRSIWSTNASDTLIYGERWMPGSGSRMPKLAARNNSLRIEVASPEYHGQNAVEYSFMLEGYDSGWSSFSSANTKEYTHLSGGTYTLCVRARNNFTQNVSETSLSFSVAPPWYWSNTAMIVYALLGLGVVWIVLIYINRRSDRRVNDMKKQKDREMREQKKIYEEEARKREKELVVLQNRALEYNLRSKSHELASSTLNLIRKNEILMEMEENIGKVIPNLLAGNNSTAASQLRRIQKEIRENIGHDHDWEKFEHNFDMVYENYLKRLGDTFPNLSLNDKRLCAYLRMDLQSKDIAPLMNISVRSVEMARYRLRKKMGLNRDSNLSEFLQRF